jgi:hypothetical protein
MIPNYLNNTLTSIAGEFANTEGPFVSGLDFDTSVFPTDLLEIAGLDSTPDLNPFQKQAIQKILTDGGRSELFKNPFSDELSSLRTRLNALVSSPGANGETILLAPAATDLLETLDHFEEHVDRMSGVTEPDENSAANPTLEKALAVGSSLVSLSSRLDGESADNSPFLSLFTSFYKGREQIDRLKNILTLADSNVVAAEMKEISNNLIRAAETDVKNFTVGVKKLRRASTVNIVWGAKDKQIPNEIMKFITTDYTEGLFENDDTRRNEEEVEKTNERLRQRNNSRSNTTTGFTRDFKTAEDLFLVGGLFESIPMNVETLRRIKAFYPTFDPDNNINTQEDIDANFKTDRNKGQFVQYLWMLKVKEKNPSARFADLWLHGISEYGDMNTIMTRHAYAGSPTTGSFIGPKVALPDNSYRDLTPGEIARVKEVLASGSRARARQELPNILFFHYTLQYPPATWMAFFQLPLP